VHDLHHRVDRVDLEPAFGEVGTVGMFVVVILEQLAQHQKVEGRCVFGFVLIIEITVAVFMTAPVDDRAMDRAHHEMDGQQQEQPPMRGEKDIKCGISRAE